MWAVIHQDYVQTWERKMSLLQLSRPLLQAVSRHTSMARLQATKELKPGGRSIDVYVASGGSNFLRR